MSITIEQIDRVMERIEELGGSALDTLFDEMDKEQSVAVNYLYEAEGEELNDEERNLIVDTSVIGWYIIKDIKGDIVPLTDSEIDTQLENNIVLFENDNSEVEETEDELINMFTEYNSEKDLILHLINFIIEESDSNKDIREDIVFTIILHVKTVIDCLLKKVN